MEAKRLRENDQELPNLRQELDALQRTNRQLETHNEEVRKVLLFNDLDINELTNMYHNTKTGRTDQITRKGSYKETT